MASTESSAACYLGQPHPWQAYLNFSQPPPSLSNDRLQRRAEIEPVLDTLEKFGKIPQSLQADDILEILINLKTEGNALFGEKEYFEAYNLYTAALAVAFQRKHWVADNIGWHLISTFYYNRATCLLKMDYFKNCVVDCESAIKLNNQYLKAYFRKAQAHKYLADYEAATSAAEDGRDVALQQNRTIDVKEFEELLYEIKSHPVEKISSKEEEKDVFLSRVLSDDRQKWHQEYANIRTMFCSGSVSSSIPVEYFIGVMTNIDKESSNLLEQRNYHVAYEFCTGVLLIAKHLETVHFVTVDKVRLSETFLRRAICAHKVDQFDKAIEDCDLALNLNKDNMESLYRKALVLKSKKIYREAFSIAAECRQMALEKNDQNLAKLCDVLIREADCHLTKPAEPVMMASDAVSSVSNGLVSVSSGTPEATISSEKKVKRKKRYRKRKDSGLIPDQKETANDDENKETENLENGANYDTDCHDVSVKTEFDSKNIPENMQQELKPVPLKKLDDLLHDDAQKTLGSIAQSPKTPSAGTSIASAVELKTVSPKKKKVPTATLR